MWDLIKKQGAGGYLEENKFYLGINPTTVSSPRFKKKATETKEGEGVPFPLYTHWPRYQEKIWNFVVSTCREEENAGRDFSEK